VTAAGSAPDGPPSDARRIVVLGDVIDDVVVIPHGPVRLDTDTPSSIRSAPGGSAANVACWLGHLGAPVDFVGHVGAADLARHEAVFRASGVVPHLAADPVLPTGTIVVVVDGQRRSMLTERGANARLHPDAVTDALLDAASALHLTGYSVVDAPDPAALVRLIARAGARGVTVSVDPGSAGYIADMGPDAFLDAVAGARVILPNLDEGRVLTGESEPERIVRALSGRFETVALTLGVEGALVADRGVLTRVDAVRADIVDPTGAGDAWAAGFLAARLRGLPAGPAAEAAAGLAARAVSATGGRPPVRP
jgi:sugar/nucleoside kinase (ribokinase family)